MKNISIMWIFLLLALPCFAANGTRVTPETKINRTANRDAGFLDVRAAPVFTNLPALSPVADNQDSHGVTLVYQASVVWGARVVGGGVGWDSSDSTGGSVIWGSSALGTVRGMDLKPAFRSWASN